MGGTPCVEGGPATLEADVGTISTPLAGVFLETESTVVAAADGRVAVAFIAIGQTQSSIGYAFSTDGGSTFAAPQVVVTPGVGVDASDPVVAADAVGNVHLTWIGFQRDGIGNPFDMHVYVATAPAGTTTFLPPVEVTAPPGVTDGLFDKPWILALADGSVVVVYADDIGVGGPLVAARSVDGAQTWSRADVVDDGGYKNLAYLCASPESGRLYVVYLASSGQDYALRLRWSDDGGQSWAVSDVTTVSDAAESVAFEMPNCVASQDEVWISYGLSTQPFTGDMALLDRVRVAHSTDGGATITDRVDAVPVCDSLSLLPQLSWAGPSTLDLVYLAGDAEGDLTGSLRWSRSADGGATWAPSNLLKEPLTFTGSRSSPAWVGDYFGSFYRDGDLYVSYPDNSSGFSHTAFLRAFAE